MKRINNKGFAISSIMYMILVLAVILIVLTLSLLSSRKLILDKLKKEVLADINYSVPVDGAIAITRVKVQNEINSKSLYEEYDDKEISLGINLSSNESSIKYKVEVTNASDVEMGIYDINGLPEYLEYELEEYILKDKICNIKNKCKDGVRKIFYITLKYKDGEEVKTEDIDIKLNFDFKQFYTITYDGITNNDYISEILGGNTLNITFTNDIPNKLKVYMNDVEISNYTYENNNLIIPNVTGNIKIEKVAYSIVYNLSNVTSSNSDTEIKEGNSYTTTLTAAEGYVLDEVIVKSGENDITTDVYVDGVVTIDSVMDNIVITASALVSE